ncbi:MAG: TonB-dependent siderophore receptor [Pseudogulbenkiania sp.]|nr:TonB-dependent siderophore receptor [Pseudogulbenkiania sp.]
MTPRRISVAVATLFLPLALPVQAEQVLPTVQVQATAESAPESYQAVTSTTATKVKAPLKDIPQTVNVVTQSLIEDQGARSLQDVLRNVPGVSFNNGDGQRDQFYIRGFNALGDMFVDGIRDDALYYRDLSNTERVEVVKGPAAVLYGRGSSGGVINRVTKKPTATPLREIELTAGSFDQKRGAIDINQPLNDSVSLRVTGALEDSGSFRNQGFLEREALAPSLAVKLGPDTKLLLQAEYLKDRRITDMGIPAIDGHPANVPVETYYGSSDARQDDYSQSTVTSGRITLDHKINDSWSLRNLFGTYRYELDRHNTNPASVVGSGASAQVRLNRGDVRRQDDGWFNQFELTQNASTGSVKHQLLYGLEFGEQQKDLVNRSRSNAATVSLYDPVLVRPDFNTTLSASSLATMNVASAYVQDLLTFTPQWKALVGVRYDEFEQRVDNRLAGQDDLRRVDREWSPRAGVVFQPVDWQSYYLSYSLSFQPSYETLVLSTSRADIEPEETQNVEVGTKLDLLDGQASFTASVFELNRTGVKTVDPETKKVLPVGEQRTRGVELTLAGEIAKGWQLSAGYAYLDAVISKSIAKSSAGIPLEDKQAALVPEHSANVWLMHELGGGFSIGGGANYVGKRFVGTDNTVSLDSYVTYDAALLYKAKTYDLALNLKNLSDEKYFVSGHDASNHLNVPGAPRSAELTARLRF